MAGFKISGKDNTEVLLAGGGSKALSDFAMSTALSGYLPLSGGTLNNNAVISRTGTSVGWVNGRSNPIIKTTSYTGYNAILSMKTTNGSWDLGVYSNDVAYFSYITDTDYSASHNATTYLLVFPKKNGTIATTSDIPTKTSQLTNDSGFLTSHQSLANYLPLSGGTMKSNAYIGFDNDATAFRMQIGADTSTSPLRGITTPTVGGRWIGIFARPGKSTDEGGFLLSQEGAAIYNSFDSGFGFKVVDTDANLNDWNSTDSVVFSVKNDNTVYSKGGFVKKNSSDSYVLLGGGGHKAVSDFLPLVAHSSMSTYIPSDLVPGIHMIHRPNVEYSSILAVKDYSGAFALLYFHPHSSWTDRILYRKGSSSWYTIAYTSDLSSYLPLSGGTLTGNENVLSIKRNHDTYGAYIRFINNTLNLGWIGFNSENVPIIRFTDWSTGYNIIHTGNISSYALTSLRIADALGAGGAPITTSVSSTRITDSYYVLATTSSGSCAWYKLPSNAFLNDNTNTTYSPGTGLSLDGTTFNAKLATNALLGVTKYVKYYSAASVKRYNGDVGGSEVDTSTTANIELAYASSTSGRFYPVLVDKNGFPFVNIPWSDTNTTYTFTTSGSGNVLTGVSTSGTTITFTKGNVSSGSTYGVVSNSENGLAPKVISTNTASIGSAYYVLASTNGSASPSWYKLPSTAFSDSNSWRPVLVDGASISSNTLNLKHGTNISLSRSNGDVTITASSQFLVVSSLPSGSSITSGVLYLVTT